MTLSSIIQYLRIVAAVIAVAGAIVFGYSVIDYVTDGAPFADASVDCNTCINNWIDGPGNFFNEPFPVSGGYQEPGGGGDTFTSPPPAPLCTLDLTAANIAWTTQNAYQVAIVPLTNSPTVPGSTSTSGGPIATIVHSEAEAYNSSAVKADLLLDGINLTAIQSNTGFAGDQTTMNRVCELVDGQGATASVWGAEGYSSPSNNAIVKWNGSFWSHIPATSFNSHLRSSFTCVKSGTIQSYPLNGSHTFVPPLGVGTHTYELTATGTGGVAKCQDTVVVPPPPEPKECKLEIVKSANKTSVAPGEYVEYTLTFKNVGDKTCTGSGVKIRDVVDPLLTYQSETHSTNVTAGYQSSPVYTASERTLRWNAWDLDPNESGWVKFVVKAETPSQCSVVVPNIGKITSYEYDNFATYVSSNTVNVTLAKDCTPPPVTECKLEITKSANVSATAPSVQFEYTLQVKNVGTKNCTGGGVKVLDVLDPRLTFVSASQSSNIAPGYGPDPVYKSSDRTVRFNADTLTPGEVGWMKLKVKAATPSACSETIPNKAKVTAYEYNNFQNFETSNVVDVVVEKDCTPPPTTECKLEISKSANKTNVVPNEEVEYTITFKNVGSKKCTGSGVKVTDLLDARLSYLSETHSTNVTAGYQSEPVHTSDRLVRWNAWDLDPNESGWVKLKVRVGTPSQCSEVIPNYAQISSYEYNNFNSWVSTQPATNITVSKDCTPPPVAPTCTLTASPYQIFVGDSSTLSWTTTNGTSFTIDHGVGSVTPVVSGATTVAPSVTTTYTGTVTGPGGTATCTKKIKVVEPPTECKIEIEKSADKSHVAPGEYVEYTINFKNVGGTKCTGSGVKLIDVVDQRLTYQSETHSAGVTAGYLSDPIYKSSDRTLRWNAWDLDPGEEGWVKFKAKVATPTSCTETIPNKAKITALELNWNYVESNTVNLTVTKDCNVPVPACSMSIDPTSITQGQSATLTWDTTNVTTASIDQGVGTVALSGSANVSPNTTTTYTGTFTGPGGTVICTAQIGVLPVEIVPQCTLTVSASTIKTGESVIVSWTSTNVTSGFITSVGTTSPVFGGSAEAFPADNTTFVGTFKGQYGDVTCQAPVTVIKGPGGCTSNCGGGGLNQPTVVMLQKPPEAPLAFVTLEQIPYTGFEAGKALTLLFWISIGLLAAIATYFVMGRGGVQFVVGNSMTLVGFGNYREEEYDRDVMPRAVPDQLRQSEPRRDSAAYNGSEYSASVAAAPLYVAPALQPTRAVVDGIPDMADVVESRAHGAGVLMSPEAVQMAVQLSKDRGEALRVFGDILNEAVKVLPREDGWIMLTSERFEELRGTTPAPVTLASPASTPSVESILASVMPPRMTETSAPSVEMPMSDADDQAVVMGLAKALLSGNRDQAYTTVRNLETNGARAGSVMTIIASAFDQLYRARRHGMTTELSTPAMDVSDEVLAKMVEIFTHGMDVSYANAFTGLKLAVAQAFEARG